MESGEHTLGKEISPIVCFICLHLNLKPTHKPVRECYAALKEYGQLGVKHMTAMKTAFQDRTYARTIEIA